MPVSWTDESVKYLITLWEQEESLYKVDNPSYHNKLKRSQALHNIYQQMVSAGFEKWTQEDMNKKMRGLRTQYLAEKNKIKASKVSGAGDADVYRPKLWTYNLLAFLETANIEASRQSTSNINKYIDEMQPSGQDCDEYSSDNAEEVLFNGTLEELNSSSIMIRENTPDSASTCSSKAKKKKSDDVITNFFTKASDVLKTSNEMADHITKFTDMLAAEMRLIKSKTLLRQLKAKIHKSLYETQEEDDKE